MSNLITPSQKMHSLVNPLPSSRSSENDSRIILILKLIFGTPVSYLMILYSVALLTSMSAMELCAWGIAALTLFYMILDLPSKNREFYFFSLGTDLSLLGLLIVVGTGLYVNAPEADFLKEFGNLRWILLLYLFSYSFLLFPGLNKLFYIIIGFSTLIAGYSIFQHFTGIDLRYEWGLRAQSAVTPAPFKDATVFQSVGLMSHHLTYGYLFSMVFCFPLAALMLIRHKSTLFRGFLIVTVIALGLSLLWTYGRGVWIATACAILFMSAYVSRKALFSILIAGVIVLGTLYSSNSGFRERLDSVWASNYTSNTDRQDLWRANIEMLSDYPWLGIGWNQNEVRIHEYYDRVGIKNEFGGHAHNNYLQILATTGILGFIFYMLFILGFLLMTHRLWGDIPKSHYWHKVFALGALGSQISLHAGGLTQWNFGDAEVNHFLIFVLAVISYMAERYSSGVVPDDHSL